MMKSKYLSFAILALAIIGIIFICGCIQQAQQPPVKQLSFVSAQGTEFIIDGKPFRFVGAFAQNPIIERIYSKHYSLNYKSAVDKYLESLPPNVNVIRIFAYGPYSKSQYGYDEPNWERLDYLVKSAEQHGVYIIWVLYDYWDYGQTGVLESYQYEFWKDENAKRIMLEQVTRYNGSPAIFGWELMNEGDVQVVWQSNEAMQEALSWIDSTAREIKAIDSKHLISTGFSNEVLREDYSNNDDVHYLAHRSWILRTYSLPSIDFVSFHAYGGNPDLQTNASFWTEEFRSELSWYYSEMVKIRQELGKPIVVEEFGAQRQVGEPYRRQVYEFYFGQLLTNKISGTFNAWADDRTPHSLSVYTYDEEYNTVVDAAEKIKTL